MMAMEEGGNKGKKREVGCHALQFSRKPCISSGKEPYTCQRSVTLKPARLLTVLRLGDKLVLRRHGRCAYPVEKQRF